LTAKVHTLAAERLLERHAGLSNGIAESLVEAAGVALARRHEPPTPLRITEGEQHLDLALQWVVPDERVRRAWGDLARATEWGAEALAIVSVDEFRGMVVVERALRGSFVDFYVGVAGGDLERAAALEVAGVDDGSIESLLRDKVAQARQNQDRLPVLAVAVRFREPCVRLVEIARSAP